MATGPCLVGPASSFALEGGSEIGVHGWCRLLDGQAALPERAGRRRAAACMPGSRGSPEEVPLQGSSSEEATVFGLYKGYLFWFDCVVLPLVAQPSSFCVEILPHWGRLPSSQLLPCSERPALSWGDWRGGWNAASRTAWACCCARLPVVSGGRASAVDKQVFTQGLKQRVLVHRRRAAPPM